MKKWFISLALLLTTALGVAPDADAAGGRQRYRQRQKTEESGEPAGAHDKRNGRSRRQVHEDANARRLREQKAKAERQETASKSKVRKKQTAQSIKAGERKKQRGRGGQ